MIYNRLYLNVIVRVVLITLTCLGFAFSIFRVHEWLLTANLLILLILQIHLFIRALNKTNTNLESFFSSLENNDTSITLQIPTKKSSYSNLLERMNKLRQRFNNLRMENEKQYHYFKAVVENIAVGMILCNEEGKVELINTAGRKLLDLGFIQHLNALNVYNDSLGTFLSHMQAGQQKMFRLSIGGSIQPIAFRVNDHRFFDKTTRIISFQNIKNELDAQELEAWQKLIRVLTHEIMNSTGPIISSIDTIKEFLIDDRTKDAKRLKDIGQDTVIDVLNGIDIIKERSIGLSDFVRNFRSLTISPQIRPQKFRVEEIFTHVVFLLSDNLKSKSIEMETAIFPPGLEIVADLKLMEQVILNLVYNAIDALENTPKKLIRLQSLQNFNNQTLIQITDNGKGIPEELLDKIFVPFFTTKEKGSGIGLSISRQIIQMHGGSISVASNLKNETCFEICLTDSNTWSNTIKVPF